MDHANDDDAAITAASKVPPPLREPCAVCGTQEAVARARRNSKPLCLLHYVTTTPQNAPPHSLIGESAAAATAQLPHAQAVFAQAFLEVRQEVQELLEEQRKEAAAEVHKKKAKKNDDPLAILSSFHGTTKKKKKRKQSPAVKEGGFLRPVPIPANLLKTQRQQYQRQQELSQRMKKATGSTPITEPKDRKQKKKAAPTSVWNLNPYKKPAPNETSIESNEVLVLDDPTPTCACGASSSNVSIVRSNRRKQDMGVAETWSNKDRDDDVCTTYQCNSCGKIWNEQE